MPRDKPNKQAIKQTMSKIFKRGVPTTGPRTGSKALFSFRAASGAVSRKRSADPIPSFDNMNPWRAKNSKVYACKQVQDNVPDKFEQNDYTFYISQNRVSKPKGQDCMAMASHGDWEVVVLCDGHDRDGLKVALGICQTLPHFVLRRIHDQRKGAKLSIVPDKLIIDSFEEAENCVCWTSEDVNVGDQAKLSSGEFAGEFGHVAVIDEDAWEAIVVIDSPKTGYQRITIDLDDVAVPRYHGGATCVMFVRNTKKGQCRVAVTGDSRLMLLSGREGVFGEFDDDTLFMPSFIEVPTSKKNQKPAAELRPLAFFTPQHNVYNAYELDRLAEDKHNKYLVDKMNGYLINPVTKFQIQPTRGFGDVDMYGTGYSHIPEISKTFILPPNSIVLGASDGIFDGEIWEDDTEFSTYLAKLRRKEMTGPELANTVFNETMKRCVIKDTVDDVSMFLLKTPKLDDKTLMRTQVSPLAKTKSQSFQRRERITRKGSVVKSRRNTITRSEAPVL